MEYNNFQNQKNLVTKKINYFGDILGILRLNPKRYPYLLQSSAKGNLLCRYDVLFSFYFDQTAPSTTRGAEDGEGVWQENNISVTSDWESSYYGDFIAGGGKKPLVVSYASSPIAELIYSDPKVEVSPTGIIKDTCFKKVEYAGIRKGAENYSEAIQLIDFLISSDFQNDIPLNMFIILEHIFLEVLQEK